jgi:hypothetical protein
MLKFKSYRKVSTAGDGPFADPPASNFFCFESKIMGAPKRYRAVAAMADQNGAAVPPKKKKSAGTIHDELCCTRNPAIVGEVWLSHIETPPCSQKTARQ